ncbi:hypothetical protein VTJ04DRAFT_1474 [Mycothermus thermophilus]|uniref:uncharacterized protein n=1 Tax=Humicola insolens TaxID=85995 RepID=UPI0037422FCA
MAQTLNPVLELCIGDSLDVSELAGGDDDGLTPASIDTSQSQSLTSSAVALFCRPPCDFLLSFCLFGSSSRPSIQPEPSPSIPPQC